jgi:uncharacterized delta-60 repeat protein
VASTDFESGHGLASVFVADANVSSFVRLDDGSYLVAGRSWDTTPASRLMLTRFHASGELDESFGIDGIAIHDFPDNDFESAFDIFVMDDGRILAVGYGMLTRLNADGSLDTSFGTGGLASLPSNTAHFEMTGVTVLTDGRIAVTGHAMGSAPDMAVAIYMANGQVDPSFNGGKARTIDFGGGVESAYALHVQPDGKLLVGGDVVNYTGNGMVLARLNANGTLDTSFGQAGKVMTEVGNYHANINAIRVQGDGKIVVAGYTAIGHEQGTSVTYEHDFALVRYNANGSRDTSFGVGGKVTTDFGASDVAFDLVILPDGRIVAGGSSGNDWSLARYLPNGTLDTSFGGDGRVTTDLGLGPYSGDVLSGLMLLDDGTLVAAGNGYHYVVLGQFRPDGTLDATLKGPLAQGQHIVGTANADQLGGTSGPDTLAGLDGDDSLTGGIGNDSLDGGAGLDFAIYAGGSALYQVNIAGDGFTIGSTDTGEGTDTLDGVERIQFADRNLALDIDGNAGDVARILGAVFGPAAIDDAAYAGAGLDLRDDGMSFEALAGLALLVKLGPSATNLQVVDLLYENAFGVQASPAQSAPYVALLDGGMSQAHLAAIAAQTAFVAERIGLSELAGTGLAYN